MSDSIERLLEAQSVAMRIRPQVGGFPYLAEVLRQSGVRQNTWNLPSCQSIFLTQWGPVVSQGKPLFEGHAVIPSFDEPALIRALRVDQAGESTFPEFLQAAWDAGVVRYEVHFDSREVTYFGVLGDSYTEAYPAVEVLL